jgi:hypothetical protein
MNRHLPRGGFWWSMSMVLLMFVSAIAASAQDANPQTIAVFYFENNSVVDKEKLDPLKKGLTDMLITEMSKVKSFRVVERQRTQSVVEELNLGDVDLVDKDTVQKMGKLLNAKVLLLGGFSNLFGDKLKEEEEIGDLDEFLTMLKSLVKKVSNDLEIKLSKVEEDQLESTKDGKFDGYVTYAQGLNLEDNGHALEKEGKIANAAAIYENARSMFQKAWNESNGYEPAKQKAEEMTALVGRMKKEKK